MLKQWWYRRKVVGAAKDVLADVLKALKKAERKHTVSAEVAQKLATATEALKAALARNPLDHSEVERLGNGWRSRPLRQAFESPKLWCFSTLSPLRGPWALLC